MGAARVLVVSELARRRRMHIFLAGVFAAATAALLLLLGAVAGVEASLGAEIEDTLSGSHRLTNHRPGELAEGFFFNGSSALASRLERAVPGSVVAPRIEAQGIFLHTSRYEDFDAGLLVGIDPVRDREAADLETRIAVGSFLTAENEWIGGKPYPQLLVGVQMLDALGMKVYNGTLARENLLNVTAGRFTSDGTSVDPEVREGVVVGAFRTGFGPIDRYTVFLDIRTARDLLRLRLADDPANVLIVRAPPGVEVNAAATAEGLSVSSSEDFRERYLAAVFDPMRAFGGVVSIVVLALAGGWVANVAANAILGDRERIAVLRALGLPTRALLGPVALLVVAAGVVGAAAGAAVASGIAAVLAVGGARIPGLPDLAFSIALGPQTVALLGSGVVLTALLAALVAGTALRKIPLTEALKG